MIDNIFDQLKRDEGEVLKVYLDSKGIESAGVGHNLIAHNINWPVGTPITQEMSDSWLKEDVQQAIDNLDTYLNWATEAKYGVRYWVLVNMAFNMGIHGLLQFHRMLTYFQDEYWANAASQMLTSLWETQVGPRAMRLAKQLDSGVWQ
jgi:lysozyme